MSRTYSPKDVDISFGGAINIDGWLSMTLGRNADNSSYEPSADGVIAYTKNADNSGVLELEVQQQNNAVNSFMAELQRRQDLSDDLLFLDVSISDKSGGVLGYANRCHLQKPSNQDLATDTTSRTWMFFVEDLPYLPDPSGFEGATKAIADAKAFVDTVQDNIFNG